MHQRTWQQNGIDVAIEPNMASKFAEDWCNAMNSGDLDALMALYAPDVEFQSPSVPVRWGIEDGWLRGIDALRANFEKGLATPGLHFELLGYTIGLESMCYFYRRENGMLGSDTVEFDDEGRAVRVIAGYGPASEGTA